MIQVRELSKQYGAKPALDRLTFDVRPGVVTGFLGPNGAGKSTTLRILLGLVRPTSGCALIGNRRYDRIRRPLHEVGAVLDAHAAHPGRTAAAHLSALARSNGIGRARVAAVLDLAGLHAVAGKRIGGFSLGMRQRLGIAAALLGDPPVIVLDEPVNGLDAAGVRWIRSTLRSLAAEGRTVLLSSHLMTETALTVDRVLVVGRGRLLDETSMADLRARSARDVLVRAPRSAELAAVLSGLGGRVTAERDGALAVRGLDATAVGDAAAAAAIAVHELTTRNATLEDVYLDLTGDAVEYRAGVAA
jgi:ABC-2 type transport system ATP-binding protein